MVSLAVRSVLPAARRLVVLFHFSDYSGLVDVGYSKHLRVNHGQNEFAYGSRHINSIESFWSFTKRRLAKFNGVSKNFEWHLKECEWRRKQSIDDLEKHL